LELETAPKLFLARVSCAVTGAVVSLEKSKRSMVQTKEPVVPPQK